MINILEGFNGHPPLGVNATVRVAALKAVAELRFQRAPTLGGECYHKRRGERRILASVSTGTHPWG